MGELRKRGKFWWIRYCRNGKRYEESAKTQKRTVAEHLLKLREGAAASGDLITPAMARYTVEQALAAVVTDYTVNRRRTGTQVARRITLHLQPWFQGRRLGSLTTADVTAYVASRLEAGAKPATINRELAVLKRACRLAQASGYVARRPTITLLAEHNVRQGFFWREDFDRVCRHLSPVLQDVVTFAYFTGWRVPSEVLTLEWTQVDLRAQEIRLEPGTTKNARGRTLAYGPHPELVALIARRVAARDALKQAGTICPWVFHRAGARIVDFREAWQSACKAEGVPGRLVHDLRRTAVRNLVRARVPEQVAMKVTGHLTRAVFDRYDITSAQDLTDAMGRLAHGPEWDKTGTIGGSKAQGQQAPTPRTA